MTRKQMVFAAVVLLMCNAVILTKIALAQRSTPLVITRIFTGPDGLSHVERVPATFQSATPPTRGIIEAHQAGTVTGDAVILRTSPDYLGGAFRRTR